LPFGAVGRAFLELELELPVRPLSDEICLGFPADLKVDAAGALAAVAGEAGSTGWY
jgi:hypothetical protein